MARPKLFSDEAILTTARDVLLRMGPSDFTLNDVAKAVGISRAALIQRFGDKAGLHRRVMEEMTREVRDYFKAAPVERGAGPLWSMLCDLIAGMGSGAETAGYVLLFWSDLQSPVLLALSRERNQLVREAIRERLPAGMAEPDHTAMLIQSVIQGSCMQWLVDRDGDLDRFMQARTAELLSILFPGDDFPMPRPQDGRH